MGLVLARTLTLANGSTGTGTININNGGTLQTATINRGIGIANFNWNDGIIQNYDAILNLTISNKLTLILAATGSHAFNIDLNRTGTIDAVVIDATTNGTLTKIGEGILTLTGINTYSGGTLVDAGRFKVTGSILNTSGITVGELATLELARATNSCDGSKLVYQQRRNCGGFDSWSESRRNHWNRHHSDQFGCESDSHFDHARLAYHRFRQFEHD